jgi:hypothetical protein
MLVVLTRGGRWVDGLVDRVRDVKGRVSSATHTVVQTVSRKVRKPSSHTPSSISSDTHTLLPGAKKEKGRLILGVFVWWCRWRVR